MSNLVIFLENQLAAAEQRAAELTSCLEMLLEAKHIKETDGKTTEYEVLKQMAWDKAEELVKDR